MSKTVKKSTLSKSTAKLDSRAIVIDDQIFIPMNLETEFTLADQNYAAKYIPERMREIAGLQESLVTVQDVDTSKTDLEIIKSIDAGSMMDMMVTMGNIELEAEMLALVYVNQGEKKLPREEKAEYFARMPGLKNREKAIKECANFTSIILKIIPGAMSIFSTAKQEVDLVG